VTLLLAHPEAEDLGRFVEGTLDDPQRTAIVDHIADCDDCRILVVDAAEFESQNAEETEKWSGKRWLANAAAVVFVVTLGGFSHHEYREKADGKEIDLVGDAPHFVTDAVRTSVDSWPWLRSRVDAGLSLIDPLYAVKGAYKEQTARPIEGRLSGFRHVAWHATRGGNDEDVDINKLGLQIEAAGAAELAGDDARTLHARGIGLLLSGDAKGSIAQLQAAAESDPRNEKYASDLAAALIAAAGSDRTHLDSAVAACDRALRIDPRSPDALFNRAVALEVLGRDNDARAAYQRYLAVDSKSPWAAEARRHFDDLQPIR
jgi:tetratricopeptide (TPR) repeat protein